MITVKLSEDGKLISNVDKAIYLDSSVFIEYCRAEYYDGLTKKSLHYQDDDRTTTKFREIVFNRNKIVDDSIIKIRDACIYGKPKKYPTITPLCIIEYIQWYSKAVFQYYVSESVGLTKNYPEKRMRDKIVNIWDEYFKTPKIKRKKYKEISDLCFSFLPNWSFASVHSFKGLNIANMINFNIDMSHMAKWEFLSQFQLGMGDILHLLLASHLGCKFFASIDQDFKGDKFKDIIKREFNIDIIFGEEAIEKEILG